MSDLKPRKTIFLFAVVAVALATPGGLGGYGGGEEGKATEVIHGGPVVTGVFKNPGQGYFNNYAPKIEGPLVTRGFGPHVSGGGKGEY
ncbi:hypothetical protein ABEB36_004429 [Hypothenemus hampei]|uniref:Uncharacterized protein n=1 Tax=Hypothenemus hampei TaxID=57062 RepID=A0ABD1F3X3_HYPHA